MKKIDAHIHFRPEDLYFDGIAADAGHENTTAHLSAECKRLGIEHGIVMGNRGLSLDEHCYPDFLSYCIGLDQAAIESPRQQKNIDLVEGHLARGGCVGIKLYAGYCPIELTDPVYAPYMALAKRYKKPVAVHTGITVSKRALLRHSHPLMLDEAAVRYPDVEFVMCHFGNPFLQEAAAVLEKNDNVVADLSGLLVGRVDVPAYLSEQSGYVSILKAWIAYVEDYNKFLYGTDWPLVNLEDYEEVIFQLVPERHWEKVFFDNACRVYQLDL